MSQEVTREEVVKAINIVAQDLGEAQSYVGRGMYGKSCLGIVSDMEPKKLSIKLALGVVSYFGNPDNDTVDIDIIDTVERLLARDVRSDSMGHDTIVYFPGIEYIP